MSTTTTTKKTTKTLTVTKRESDNFFDDSFFKDSWGDFDSAMKQVLGKFESETPKESIDMGNRTVCTDVYRKIRSDNVSKDLYQSQALQVTEKDGKFQCVMDVKDFNPNDLQVKVVEDRVVVDGKFEKKSEDGLSMSSKSFHKEFSLPSVADIEKVSTALSRDGVLTIKAPKKEGTEVAVPSGPVTQSTTQSTQQSSQTSSKTDDGSTSSSQSTKKETKSFKSSSTFSSTKQSSTSSNVSSFDTSSALPEAMQDRLVFTHDTANVKLPSK